MSETYLVIRECDNCGRAMPAGHGRPFGESYCNRHGCKGLGGGR